ncbi:hypothetical protein vBVpaMR16F_127 [Vibrio phage vB_VpaM_R16F]|nr:hypothetical protein vBVpaMR16F_127 [Vibrio phage vB_VpaM_R16F]
MRSFNRKDDTLYYRYKKNLSESFQEDLNKD